LQWLSTIITMQISVIIDFYNGLRITVVKGSSCCGASKLKVTVYSQQSTILYNKTIISDVHCTAWHILFLNLILEFCLLIKLLRWLHIYFRFHVHYSFLFCSAEEREWGREGACERVRFLITLCEYVALRYVAPATLVRGNESAIIRASKYQQVYRVLASTSAAHAISSLPAVYVYIILILISCSA